MNELELTGGARIGTANATFPFATLKVSKTRLDLNATIIGNLTFQQSDIISIEPYTMIPFIGQGIKINHKVSNYDAKVIFWTFRNPISVVNQIKETGFLNKQNISNEADNRIIIDRQSKGGFPIKKSVAIGAFAIWNLLFLIDIIPFFMSKADGLPFGKGVLSAIGLLFLSSLLCLVSSNFRSLILKEGRELIDIKKFAIFLMIISGAMFLNIGFLTNFLQ